MRILGVPSTAHREALLRETAGGGRVPMSVAPFVAEAAKLEPAYGDDGRSVWTCPRCGQWTRRMYQEVWGQPNRVIAHLPACDLWALILHDPADPEAGAMGRERCRWVEPRLRGLLNADGDPLSAEEAREFGLAAVRLGLLDRVEAP